MRPARSRPKLRSVIRIPVIWLRRFWPEALLAVLLALPWLALLVLGAMWLWDNGRVLEWALASAALVLAGLPLRVFVRRRAEARLQPDSTAEPIWDAEERAAWAKVQTLAEATPILGWDESDRAEALMRETIELVARHFHPDRDDAVAHVTLPEALLLAEIVSRGLRRWVLEHGAFAQRVKISQLLYAKRQVDRYGTVAWNAWKVAEPVWRAFRFVRNPVTAIAQEAARLTTAQVTGLLGESLRRVATQEIILQTGRTAIDLYAGRLRRSSEERAALIAADAATAKEEAPLRLLLVGQARAGKTSLLNALAGASRGQVDAPVTQDGVREHLVRVDGRPALNVADMPPLSNPARFLEQAARADIILWVCVAIGQPREPDRAALEALRAWAAERPANRIPPLFVAMTGADRLLPAATLRPDSMPEPVREAAAALAGALDLPAGDVVPVALGAAAAPWNLPALWARLEGAMEPARIARFARIAERDHRPSLMAEAGTLVRSAGAGIRRLWDSRRS